MRKRSIISRACPGIWPPKRPWSGPPGPPGPRGPCRPRRPPPRGPPPPPPNPPSPIASSISEPSSPESFTLPGSMLTTVRSWTFWPGST
ncbi:hypothetical protein CMK11_11035 [Candidatus Poribacteria bacterium]|nr:hypothetical protein [Candidatus Poribacteria bacterium]